jgi:hypothetical protein
MAYNYILTLAAVIETQMYNLSILNKKHFMI